MNLEVRIPNELRGDFAEVRIAKGLAKNEGSFARRFLKRVFYNRGQKSSQSQNGDVGSGRVGIGEELGGLCWPIVRTRGNLPVSPP
jgi:hypothetical protein